MRQDLKSQIYDLDAKLDSALRLMQAELTELCEEALAEVENNDTDP